MGRKWERKGNNNPKSPKLFISQFQELILGITPKLLEKECVYLSSVQIVGIKLKSDKEHTVRSVWERACRYVGYDEADYSDLGEAIREKSPGTLLKDLPD